MNENTLFPEFLQVHSLTLFPGQVSSSRADMFASEIGQAPPLKDSNVRRLLTGMERRFGAYTDMIKIPGNCSVVRVVTKRPPNTIYTRKIPNEITVIYHNVDTGAYGSVTIPIYSCNHQQFGFDFVRTPIVESLYPGKNLAKDTILAHSPSLTANGDYKFGINGKIAFLSIPEVAQDGVVISESFAKRATFKGYGVRTLSFGGDTVPLNLYGNDEEYKIFPDVGEQISPDGLLFAVRRLTEGLGAVEMSRRSLQQWEETDKRAYDSAYSNGVVTKIEVFHNNQMRSQLPAKMVEQCVKYLNSTAAYYQDLLSVYRQIEKESPDKPVLEPAFQNLLTKAIAHEETRGGDRSAVNFVSNGNPLNEWTVKIYFSYDLEPDKVFKCADLAGGKAVVVSVWPDWRMPVDARGTRAELIMDGGSIVNRLNPSRLTEQYLNGSLDTAWEKIRYMASVGASVDDIFQYILGLYKIMSPKFHEIVLNTANPKTHVDTVIKDGFYIWLPTNNPVDYVRVREELEQYAPPLEGRLCYFLEDGTKVEVEKPAIIADQYFIWLEKIGDDYSSVASPVLQPQGVPGKLTRADKFSSPGRPQAIRGIGETEMRILATLVDVDMPSDLLDIANSPTTHRHVCRELLTHPTPTNIPDIIPRDIVPRGNNRVVQQVQNSLLAAGYEIVEKPVENER